MAKRNPSEKDNTWMMVWGGILAVAVIAGIVTIAALTGPNPQQNTANNGMQPSTSLPANTTGSGNAPAR